MAQASVPTALPLSATDLLAQALPDLNISPDPSQCHASHDIKYVTSLKPWPSFKFDVLSDFQCQPWSQTTLGCYVPDSSTDEFSRGIEYVEVGTECGVRGRYNERVDQYVGPVFKVQQIDLVSDGFGCQKYVISDERAPSLIITNKKFETRVPGEVRVPWIDQHDVELMVGDMDSGNDVRLRRGIGQLARAMQDMDIKYGFLSNYNRTVFLRQVALPDGIGLEYSPVFYRDERYDLSQ